MDLRHYNRLYRAKEEFFWAVVQPLLPIVDGLTKLINRLTFTDADFSDIFGPRRGPVCVVDIFSIIEDRGSAIVAKAMAETSFFGKLPIVEKSEENNHG